MPSQSTVNRTWLGLGLAGVLAAGLAVAAVTRPSAAPAAPTPARKRAADELQAAVAAAREQVQATPEHPPAYQRLAVALMQLQRQDGDPELYRDAERALREGLRRHPGDYETEKLLAWVLAGQHRFDEALAVSRRLAAKNPADYWNYGVIGDALTETGDYPGAVAAVQKMVDCKPGGLSYARAAHLRRLHGDTDGALNLYSLALEATSTKDREGTAWLRTQCGDLRLSTGDLEGAAREYDAAVRSLPGYRLAVAGQAHLAAALGRLDEAAGKYVKLLAAHERPDWRAALGDLYTAQGKTDQAEAQYRRVEAFLRDHMEDPIQDARHQLAQFLADRGRDPRAALKLALAEAADATDIKALDTLAWSLYHAGRYPEAWSAARKALRLGTQDAKLLYHAGMIAARIPGAEEKARVLLRKALALHPDWDVLDAPAARAALESLTRGNPGAAGRPRRLDVAEKDAGRAQAGRKPG